LLNIGTTDDRGSDMGDIGPVRERYEVLPGHAFGIEDADDWTAPARLTMPTPSPDPGPIPDPGPTPGPEPLPSPGPDVAPPNQR
jgi:hypothetical protein